jgi:hypothetical protein
MAYLVSRHIGYEHFGGQGPGMLGCKCIYRHKNESATITLRRDDVKSIANIMQRNEITERGFKLQSKTGALCNASPATFNKPRKLFHIFPVSVNKFLRYLVFRSSFSELLSRRAAMFVWR